MSPCYGAEEVDPKGRQPSGTEKKGRLGQRGKKNTGFRRERQNDQNGLRSVRQSAKIDLARLFRRRKRLQTLVGKRVDYSLPKKDEK